MTQLKLKTRVLNRAGYQIKSKNYASRNQRSKRSKTQPKVLTLWSQKTKVGVVTGDHLPFTASNISISSSSHQSHINPTMATTSTTATCQLSCFSSLNRRLNHLHRRSILSLPQSPRYKVPKKPNLFYFLLIQ